MSQLPDLAASLRSDHLHYLRSLAARALYSHFESEGHPLLCPAAWTALPRPQRVERVLTAEDRRVAAGTTFVLDTPVVDAVRAVAADRTVPLVFTEDVLPAPSGMLVTAAPLHDLGQYSVVAASWGPAMEGFGPGVHLTWWTDGRAVNEGKTPLLRDFELHLPFPPIVDSRLIQADLPDGLSYSAGPLRAVVAAWYALTGPGTEITEQRPSPVIGRALAAQKAKQRGVRVATTTSAEATRQAVLDQAAAQHARLLDTHGPQIGGIDPSTTPPQQPSHGPFPAELDHQLPPDQRRTAQLYREAAERWTRREMEIFQQYPGILEQLEELRVRDHGNWQPWCWMPISEVALWLIRQWNVPAEQALWDAARIAAIGAWRSGGRHALVHGGPRHIQLPDDPVPGRALRGLPVPGIGVVVEDGPQVRLVLACLDQPAGHDGGELVLLDDGGERSGGFRDLTKTTLLLADGQSLTEAVKATSRYYDAMNRAGGRTPLPEPGEAAFVQQAAFMGWFTGVLAAASAPGAMDDAGADAGRKPAASWPPEPSLVPELVLWRLRDNGQR
ncbi:hypothetical protein ACIQC7_34490 [Kitasatospora sp. NPDC088556]|uniref:hypothetical protein n=1 Tax=Kitasatospora sp. NPDC088556 TaxID=3364076 RepID=UPI00382851E2